MGPLISWFIERHPLIAGFVLSLLLMAVIRNEIFCHSIWTVWGIIGAGRFLLAAAKEAERR